MARLTEPGERMSTAPAEAVAAPAAGGKKKLIIIIAAVLVLVLGGGGAAFMLLKPKPEAEEGAEDDGHGGGAKASAKKQAPVAVPRGRTVDPKNPPVFVPLDPFTVNLADRESERYAQIGLTLELDDPKIAEELKLFMPAIRNNILMVLSSRTAAQMLTREGKERLARSILLATVRPLGFPAIDDDEDLEEEAHTDEAAPPKKKRKRRAPDMVYPVTAVHFSTFIVQ
jgi:flagellar FliL protein